jgi:protein-L-isoaspartate(D-aspartate) O-methyltransferase
MTERLVEQLAEGGIMLLPLGPRLGPQILTKVTKHQDGLARQDLIGVRAIPWNFWQAIDLLIFFDRR